MSFITLAEITIDNIKGFYGDLKRMINTPNCTVPPYFQRVKAEFFPNHECIIHNLIMTLETDSEVEMCIDENYVSDYKWFGKDHHTACISMECSVYLSELLTLVEYSLRMKSHQSIALSICKDTSNNIRLVYRSDKFCKVFNY